MGGLFNEGAKRKKTQNKISDASIAVLMLGQRRTGKSSMLAAMLDSMEKQSVESDLLFVPDKSTKLLMDKKKANLESIFEIHEGQTIFSTVMDLEPNGTTEHYLFSLERQKRNPLLGENTGLTVDFIDIRGEDLNDDDANISDQMARTAIWMISVDTPALMEDRDGVINKISNDPILLHSRIVGAYNQIRKNEKKPIPRLVLFIPIKCEKYYHDGQMDAVNARIKSLYKNVFCFFQEHKEFTVAITPILTLGDVVFDHYQITEQGDYMTCGGEEGDTPGMRQLPVAMFRFRNENGHIPVFSPQFCNQPLYYVLAYFLVSFKKLRKLSAGKNMWDFVRFFFGPLGYLRVTYERVVKALSDKETRKALQNIASKLKASDDGYEIVFDGINIESFKEE